MTNSGSMHFSDKLSYKKHFISSYGSKDMNFAISAHLQQFSVKQIKWSGFFSPKEISARVADRRGQGDDWDVAGQRWLRWRRLRMTGRVHLSGSEKNKKGWLYLAQLEFKL
jgi:hypothetical protein